MTRVRHSPADRSVAEARAGGCGSVPGRGAEAGAAAADGSSFWPQPWRRLVLAWVRIDESLPLRITCLAGAVQRQYEPDCTVIDDTGVHWIVDDKRGGR